jgi:D-sedoheptulose 7-phosphate isomerase
MMKSLLEKIQSYFRGALRKEFGPLAHWPSSGNTQDPDPPVRRSMEYPERYKARVLEAIQSIDLNKVGQAIQLFKSARVHGRRIFVCGNGGSDSVAAQFLCDLVKEANYTHSSPFRILALTDQSHKLGRVPDEVTRERVFVEQLKNFAEPEDVVMGLCTTGNAPKVVNAVEYAAWIGCHTIGVTGVDGGRLAQLAELNVHVSVAHMGSVEDAHVIICHMIGYYFADLGKG